MLTKQNRVEHVDILNDKQYSKDLVEKDNERLFVEDARKTRLDAWIPYPGEPSIGHDTDISRNLLIDR